MWLLDASGDAAGRRGGGAGTRAQTYALVGEQKHLIDDLEAQVADLRIIKVCPSPPAVACVMILGKLSRRSAQCGGGPEEGEATGAGGRHRHSAQWCYSAVVL